jgi:multiple sugar transport system substrate-binding protein
MRKTILIEGQSEAAGYDIVSFDALWTPELAQSGVLLPLDAWQAQTPEVAGGLYLKEAINGARWEGRTYGLPIQPHAELLWYRTDLFAKHQLQPPRNMRELVAHAKVLNNPGEGVYGVVWNGQRGSALGQTVSHLYAAMGSELIHPDKGPQIDSVTGRQVLTLLTELMRSSPPDILTTAWDQRRQRYLAGHTAMAYGWGARMGEGLLGPISEVTNITAVSSPPMAENGPLAIPFGTWNLGIVGNIPEPRKVHALKVLELLCGASGAKKLVIAGNAGVPMRHLLSEPLIADAIRPLVQVMAELEERQAFSNAARPRTPLWNDLSILVGEIFHDALRGEISIKTALSTAQSQADDLWQSSQQKRPDNPKVPDNPKGD